MPCELATSTPSSTTIPITLPWMQFTERSRALAPLGLKKLRCALTCLTISSRQPCRGEHCYIAMHVRMIKSVTGNESFEHWPRGGPAGVLGVQNRTRVAVTIIAVQTMHTG